MTVKQFLRGQLLNSRQVNNWDFDLRTSAELLDSTPFCSGITDPNLQHFVGSYFHREQSYCITQQEATSTIRSNRCSVKGPMCVKCRSLRRTLMQRLQRQKGQNRKVVALRTPLQKMTKDSLVKALKQQRLSAKKRLKACDTVEVDEATSTDLENILSANTGKMTRQMKVFWQEQKKNLSMSCKGNRWQPYVIRIARMLHSQSSSAYRSLRNTGVLQLPSEKTLRDYSHDVCRSWLQSCDLSTP